MPSASKQQHAPLPAQFISCCWLCRADGSGDRLKSSGFSDFTMATCNAAAALPPAAVCAAEARPQMASALQALRLVAACFSQPDSSEGPPASLAHVDDETAAHTEAAPLRRNGAANGGLQGTSPSFRTAEEAGLLLALMRRQLKGERAAASAAHAERRLGGGSSGGGDEAPLAVSPTHLTARSAVTEVALAAIACCWQDLEEQVLDIPRAPLAF